MRPNLYIYRAPFVGRLNKTVLQASILFCDGAWLFIVGIKITTLKRQTASTHSSAGHKVGRSNSNCRGHSSLIIIEHVNSNSEKWNYFACQAVKICIFDIYCKCCLVFVFFHLSVGACLSVDPSCFPASVSQDIYEIISWSHSSSDMQLLHIVLHWMTMTLKSFCRWKRCFRYSANWLQQ